jgi:hypothetical protein
MVTTPPSESRDSKLSPTESDIEPAVPVDVPPVETSTVPEAPEEEAPVKIDMVPLDPPDAEFAVATVIRPLVVDAL